MTSGTRVIENPLSGELITIHTTAEDTGGGLLAWELQLAPGGQVPSSHAHPGQEERFTVLEGLMRFRVGGRRFTAVPGQTVRVPPGAVHHFANPGPRTARVAVETRPALGMRELLETAAAMAREQQSAGRKLPRLADLALFMREFRREVRAPYIPAPLAGAVLAPVAWVARRGRPGRRYEQLRNRQPGDARS